MKIAINEQNEATIDAFLAEVKKVWKAGLKQAQQKQPKSNKKQDGQPVQTVEANPDNKPEAPTS